MNKQHSFRALLVDQFSERRLKNKQYSIRAFARDLGICKSSLAYALSGQRDLSKGTKEKISAKLALSPMEVSGLSDGSKKFHQIDEDHFQMISNWFCFAIYALLKTPRAQLNPEWIAKRLGISAVEAKKGIDCLLSLGLIIETKNGFKHTNKIIKTTEDVVSKALKHHHRQNLSRAMNSLHFDSLDMREFTSITVPANPKSLPFLKKEIRKFRDKMLKTMENDAPKEVYTLAIQLFPQSVVGGEK